MPSMFDISGVFKNFVHLYVYYQKANIKIFIKINMFIMCLFFVKILTLTH